MKPIELLNKETDVSGYSETLSLFNRYKNTECVIAYKKSFMGCAFVIRSSKDIFGFVIYNRNLNGWESVKIERFKLKIIKRLFDETDSNNINIIDEENYKLFERKVLFDALENGR